MMWYLSVSNDPEDYRGHFFPTVLNYGPLNPEPEGREPGKAVGASRDGNDDTPSLSSTGGIEIGNDHIKRGFRWLRKHIGRLLKRLADFKGLA